MTDHETTEDRGRRGSATVRTGFVLRALRALRGEKSAVPGPWSVVGSWKAVRGWAGSRGVFGGAPKTAREARAVPMNSWFVRVFRVFGTSLLGDEGDHTKQRPAT